MRYGSLVSLFWVQGGKTIGFFVVPVRFTAHDVRVYVFLMKVTLRVLHRIERRL